jgi:hypothetical protein
VPSVPLNRPLRYEDQCSINLLTVEEEFNNPDRDSSRHKYWYYGAERKCSRPFPSADGMIS